MSGDLLESDEVQYSDSDYGYGSEDVEVDVASGEAAGGASSKQTSYTVITREQLQTLQDECLQSVQGILGCNSAIARALLIYYQWDKERLFGTLAERGEEWVYRAAGVTCPSASSAQAPSSCQHQSGGEVTCGTCFCEVPVAETTTMECGHTFCDDCWRGHFKVQISEGKSRRLTCMGVKCNIICDETKVKAVLSGGPHGDEAIRQLGARYETSLLESYVEDNRKVRWCPSRPHCGGAVRVEGEPHMEPECTCGERFCFNCGLEPHSPCTCEMWKAWKQKCADDSETNNWIRSNTKPCPKCSKAVEKNAGCNLVVCMCGQAFCWLCGQATGREHTWTSIAGHSCGRWKEEADKRADNSKRQLERYLHYYKRYAAHLDSRRHESRTREQVQAKIAVLEDKDNELKDYTWLMQALNQLCEARGILGYSYTFAYYMFGNDMFKDEISEDQNQVNKCLFEDQQQQLESEAERLSGLILTPEAAMGEEVRYAIINSASNIEKRIFNLYKLIENDVLAQLQYSPNDIAPYKGISTLQADALNDRLVAQANAAAAKDAAMAAAAILGAEAAAAAAAAGGPGPSGSGEVGSSSRAGAAAGSGRKRSGRQVAGRAVGGAVQVVDLTGDGDEQPGPSRRITRTMSAGKRPAPPAAAPPNPRQRH